MASHTYVLYARKRQQEISIIRWKTNINSNHCDDEIVFQCIQTPESQNCSIMESECNNMELTSDVQRMLEMDINDQCRCGLHDNDNVSNPLYDDTAFGGNVKKISI